MRTYTPRTFTPLPASINLSVTCGFLLAVSVSDAQNLGRERRQERRAEAREQYPDLTKSLQNPLARIVSIPTRLEYLDGAGEAGVGESFALSFSPRIPISLSENWHILSKTDIAWKRQENVFGVTEQEGLTDLTQTFFFSPDRSLAWDVYWGVGPTFVLPTATDDFLGTDKWSIGPSAALYKQTDQWIGGVLFNHVWSVDGDDLAPDVNASLIAPLIGFTAPTATTFALSSEITHNWQDESWVVPIELRVSQLTILYKRPVQWTVGAKYFVTDEAKAPDWGAYFQITIPLKSDGWSWR